jgi:hypothetical protein
MALPGPRPSAVPLALLNSCNLYIDAKFCSPAWKRSPFRRHKFRVEWYKSFKEPRKVYNKDGTVKEVIPREPWTIAQDIRQMIHRRDEMAKADPYASWDAVTCTMTRNEMLKLAKTIDGSNC